MPPGDAAVARVHPALLGELDGVADQVEQHLAQPQRIAEQRHGHVVGDVAPRRPGPSPRRAARPALTTLSSVSPRSKAVCSRSSLPGLDLREIQDVVDDAQQGVRRAVDLLQVVALLGVSARVAAPAPPCR